LAGAEEDFRTGVSFLSSAGRPQPVSESPATAPRTTSENGDFRI